MNTVTIRPATPADAEPMSQLRLEALRSHPEAFGSDYETSAKKTQDEWVTRLRENDGISSILYLACEDDALAGMTGIVQGQAPKMAHYAFIWGVYVRPAYRRQGVAGQLLQACLDWASTKDIELVKLAVVNTNVAAIRCYAAAGFRVYGVEPRVIRVDGVDYDELLMVRELG